MTGLRQRTHSYVGCAPAGPRRYFARWISARRQVVVVRLSAADQAVVVCALLRAAGVRARAAHLGGGEQIVVTVPGPQLAAARQCLSGSGRLTP